MTAAVRATEADILGVLATVTDPGYVRSVVVDDVGVTVHLRLPAALRTSTGAYLAASDALDALEDTDGLGQVRVLLDGAPSGEVFRRRAHTAATERAVAALLRETPMTAEQIGRLLLRDLPEGKAKTALLRRRFALGLSNCPNSRVLVDGVVPTPVPAFA
ncbi:hypothetical protein [Mycolicibacterium sp.]|uniref:hypothetical protein n=1 Tax=Mycolicibacterium sp. TaxID=2320850 RepID=UPI003D139AF0